MSSSTFIPEGLSNQQLDQAAYFQLYMLQFYLQRIQANLSLINAPASGNTVTVMNTNLFKLAAIYYGDPIQWPIIANANNITDPMITTPTTLFIPIWNQQNTDGIL